MKGLGPIGPFKKFFERQMIETFETGFAVVCIYTGLSALSGWGVAADIFRNTLGGGLAVIFNVTYLVAGTAIFFGIGLNKINVEAVGLIIVSMSLVIRCAVVISVVGLNDEFRNYYWYALVFITMSCCRLYALSKYQWIVQPKNPIVTALPEE